MPHRKNKISVSVSSKREQWPQSDVITARSVLGSVVLVQVAAVVPPLGHRGRSDLRVTAEVFSELRQMRHI